MNLDARKNVNTNLNKISAANIKAKNNIKDQYFNLLNLLDYKKSSLLKPKFLLDNIKVQKSILDLSTHLFSSCYDPKLNCFNIESLNSLARKAGIEEAECPKILSTLIHQNPSLFFSGKGVNKLTKLGYERAFNILTPQELKKLFPMISKDTRKILKHKDRGKDLDILVSPSDVRKRTLSQRILFTKLNQFYFHPLKTMPELVAAYDCGTKIRSEQRQAVVKTLKAMVYLLDLRTMELGIFLEKGDIFWRAKVNRIVSLTGISLSRVKEVIRRLKMAGFFQSVQHRIKTVSKKTLSSQLFHMFGIWKQFVKDREYARTKMAKWECNKDKKQSQSILSGIAVKMNLLRNQSSNNQKSNTNNFLKSVRNKVDSLEIKLSKLSHKDNRQVLLNAIKIGSEHPTANARRVKGYSL